MSVVMFIIFLLTDIGMVGIFAFIYSGKEQYSEGMILGVHIPKTEINHEEVQGLGEKYKKSLKKFNCWNLILGTLVCVLFFWKITLAIIIWLIWLIVYLAVGEVLIYASHRQMYDIKMKHNWIVEGNTHIVHIDTVVSSMTEKLPISHVWSLSAVLFLVISLCLPQMREYFGTTPVQWSFPGGVLLIMILFWGLHLWFLHRKNIVYSADSSINMVMNRLEKRTWSVILLTVNYLNLLSWGYLTIKIMRNQWLYDADYWIYIALQIIPVFVIVIGIVYMQKRRKEVLSMDVEPIIVDDDEYWKNGWYYNVNDSHLWVQDRMCSTNYSMNMAKSAAKTIAVGTVVFLTATIVAVFALMLIMENAQITFLMDEDQVTIDAMMYDTHFNVSEIESVKLLDKMPEDDFSRTNGADTEKYLIGHFEGKETGKCMMYLYRDYNPILAIKLPDETIYINSKEENKVQEWYQKLLE